MKLWQTYIAMNTAINTFVWVFLLVIIVGIIVTEITIRSTKSVFDDRDIIMSILPYEPELQLLRFFRKAVVAFKRWRKRGR